jgi:glyoxylase-like metal-dependent hydrolase (beta-lactamase superfamily II)
MRYEILAVTNFQQNCSLLWCETTLQGVLVDPGGDEAYISEHVEKHQVKIEKILLTHGHLDHVGGAQKLAEHFQVPILGPHEDDAFWLDALPQQCQYFGLDGRIDAFRPTQWLSEGDSVSFGEQNLEVLLCPGHTPGHIVFFHRADKLALVGDVLFQGSIGRTDFPRGNFDDLIQAITTKLLPLGDDVLFIPGHGVMSTFGRERMSNPFIPR